MALPTLARVRCRGCGREFVARASRPDELVRCSHCGMGAEAGAYEVVELVEDMGSTCGAGAGTGAGSELRAGPPVGVDRARGPALPPSDLRSVTREGFDEADRPGGWDEEIPWELDAESVEGRVLRQRMLERNRAAFTGLVTALATVLSAGLLVLGISKHLGGGDDVVERRATTEKGGDPPGGGVSLDRQLEEHLDLIRRAEIIESAAAVANRFLGAGSAQEMLECVRGQEHYREAVESFWARHPAGLHVGGELAVEELREVAGSDSLQIKFSFVAEEPGGRPKLLLVRREGGDPYEVDWPFFYQFYEGTLERFLDGELGTEDEFFLEFTRVHAQGEILPFGEHSVAYRILGMRGDSTPRHFFVDGRTGLGEALRERFGWQSSGAMRLRLKWEEPGEGSERREPFIRVTWMEGYQ